MQTIRQNTQTAPRHGVGFRTIRVLQASLLVVAQAVCIGLAGAQGAADDAPLRLVQVVRTGNRALVADKPTVLQVRVDRGAGELAVRLRVDGRDVDTPVSRVPGGWDGSGAHDRLDLPVPAAACAAGGRRFELDTTDADGHVQRQVLTAAFRAAPVSLRVRVVRVGVREGDHVTWPERERVRRLTGLAHAVFPVAAIDTRVAEGRIVVDRADFDRATARQNRIWRTELLARIVLASGAAWRATPDETGVREYVVGVLPDIRGLMLTETGRDARGFAVRHLNACLVQADEASPQTFAHELAHLPPFLLDDAYATPEAPATSHLHAQDGAYNVAYTHPWSTRYAPGETILAGHTWWRSRPTSLMGSGDVLWPSRAEYERLFAALHGVPAEAVANTATASPLGHLIAALSPR